MVGLFFFTWGATSTVIEVVIFVFKEHNFSLPWTCDIWYYLVLQCSAVLGVVMFTLVARWYQNRQRGEIKQERFYREAAL